jgi:hypothetical protein
LRVQAFENPDVARRGIQRQRDLLVTDVQLAPAAAKFLDTRIAPFYNFPGTPHFTSSTERLTVYHCYNSSVKP